MRLLFEIDKKDYDPDGKASVRVIVESVAEFGYVHRIQKGKHEPVFIQDNFYYLCDVTEGQVPPQFTENEKKEEFVPCFVDLNEAIRVNEEYVKENSYDSMIERELRVMKMIAEAWET